jgi:two-component system CheB/CheR fusion protein
MAKRKGKPPGKAPRAKSRRELEADAVSRSGVSTPGKITHTDGNVDPPTSTPGGAPSLHMEEVPLPEFPIVGVGASAGGLEAFTQLVRALPPDFNIPIVLVQHLSPGHESLIPNLLHGTTHLRAVQAAEGMELERATIYVSPPNHSMEIEGGRLRLRPRPTERVPFNPIDSFFRSLAAYGRQRAIGVVLSGSASDGSAGIGQIKTLGGITLAQKPETAKHDGMPRAAIATGAVDRVLSPGEIASELGLLSGHPYLALDPRAAVEEASALRDDQLSPLLTLLRRVAGVDFSQYKTATIKRRLQRRMALNRVTELDQYLSLVKSRPEEIRELYQDILIHVTQFFREPESFASLRHAVFPAILSRKRRDGESIRVWVAGCSTGEEAYSVAIELLEFIGDDAGSVPIQIFATDLSEAAVDKARAGVFASSISQDVSRDRLRRFFTHANDSYRVNKSVRDLCIFARQDLTRDPPFSRLDLIVCRNVLIYMAVPLQRRVLSIFHYALKPQGYLMLGSAETAAIQSDLFSVADKRHRLYSKKATEPNAWLDLPRNAAEREPSRPRRIYREPTFEGGVHGEADRILLDRYAPASILVDADFQILHTRRDAAKYLTVAPGEPTFNILKMLREGLVFPVREAVQQAKTQNERVRKERVRVQLGRDRREVNLEVLPLTVLNVPAQHFLLIFEEAQGGEKGARTGRKESVPGVRPKSRVAELEQELSASREYLQSTIQDLEAANEELQSANEEILSSNEELQSTNEELDTAKEELQSANEELNTINEELHARNEELARVNSDLVNFIGNVDVAIVIIARDLRVRRFTPMAEKMLNLIPADVGRPIRQVKPNFELPELEDLIVQSIESLEPREREVSDRDGRRYLLRIQPYKDIENRIDGAVLVVVDIESSLRHETATGHFLKAILDRIRDPIAVVNARLQLRWANESFAKLAGGGAAAEGTPIADVLRDGWNQSEVLAAIRSSDGNQGAPAASSLVHLERGEMTFAYRLWTERILFDAGPLTLLRFERVESSA